VLHPGSEGFIRICQILMRKVEGVVGDLPEFVLVVRRIPGRLRTFTNRLLEHFERGLILRDQDCC
jgi:hypothetical protein